jgi:hypothetical protein
MTQLDLDVFRAGDGFGNLRSDRFSITLRSL